MFSLICVTSLDVPTVPEFLREESRTRVSSFLNGCNRNPGVLSGAQHYLQGSEAQDSQM